MTSLIDLDNLTTSTSSANTFFIKLDNIISARDETYIMYKTDRSRKYLCNVSTFFDNFGDWKSTFVWGRQRLINDDTVEDIVRSMEGNSPDIMIMNMDIRFGMVNGKDPKIIDGQHRLSALERMEPQVQFIISICDFLTEDERFLQFKAINSSTPLPEYYKAITDRDSYCKTVASEIYISLKKRYPDLVKSEQYFIQPKDEQNIYSAIRRTNMPMGGDIPGIVHEVIELCSSPLLFPASNHAYLAPRVDPDKCKAQQSKDNKAQCSWSPKEGDYCGTHRNCGQAGSSCKIFNSRLLLGSRFSERQSSGCGLFLLNDKWVDKITNEMYPINLLD